MIPDFNVIPQLNGAFCAFPKQYKIAQTDYTAVFISRMSKLGYTVNNNAEFCIEFILDKDKNNGYLLVVAEDKITITAYSTECFNYALVSLYQLVATGGGRVSCGIYADQFNYGYRGIMLDCCRHFVETEEIKKIIEQMSLLKLNKFHWHLSDDQGFRVESKAFPLLNSVASYRKLDEYDPLVENGENNEDDIYGGYYTQDEIREVVSYAEERFVEVIPEIEFPGHSTAILAAYNYSCRDKRVAVASTFGVHERIFCAGSGRRISLYTLYWTKSRPFLKADTFI